MPFRKTSFSPLDIAQAEVLDLIKSHIEMGEAREPRYGPESKEFTEIKRQELITIHDNLADQWDMKRYEKTWTALCEEDKEHSFMGFSESDVAAMRPDLSEGQCYEILAIAEQHYDPSLGVTWDTLEIYADREFGPATKEA